MLKIYVLNVTQCLTCFTWTLSKMVCYWRWSYQTLLKICSTCWACIQLILQRQHNLVMWHAKDWWTWTCSRFLTVVLSTKLWNWKELVSLWWRNKSILHQLSTNTFKRFKTLLIIKYVNRLWRWSKPRPNQRQSEKKCIK